MHSPLTFVTLMLASMWGGFFLRDNETRMGGPDHGPCRPVVPRRRGGAAQGVGSAPSVKSPQLAFVVSTDEYLRIKRKSEKAHMSISDYVRVALGSLPTIASGSITTA
jgi:hypothetical protein